MVPLVVLGLVLGLGTAQDNLQIVGQRNYNLARVGQTFWGYARLHEEHLFPLD